MITGIAGNMESMLVEQWAYRETDEHRENLFHQQSICLAVYVRAFTWPQNFGPKWPMQDRRCKKALIKSFETSPHIT